MAEYLTNNTDLKKVADAIRAKGGTSAALAYPDEYVSAINAITTGIELKIVVSVTTGATVTATKGRDRYVGQWGLHACCSGGRYMERQGYAGRANVRYKKRLRRR